MHRRAVFSFCADSNHVVRDAVVYGDIGTVRLAGSHRVQGKNLGRPTLHLKLVRLTRRAARQSPLYTLSGVFEDAHGALAVPTPDDIRGALSQIVWLITCVVCVKYIGLLMTLGHFNGEGGPFAMMRRVKRSGECANRPRLWGALQHLAIAGVALIVADGTLTPVVTVMSAVARGRCSSHGFAFTARLMRTPSVPQNRRALACRCGP